MNYRILWLPTLEDVLISMYLDAERHGDADAVTKATVRIDKRLLNNPMGEGESRHGNVRVMVEAPLTVHFEVFESERVVVVIRIHYVPRRQ